MVITAIIICSQGFEIVKYFCLFRVFLLISFIAKNNNILFHETTNINYLFGLTLFIYFIAARVHSNLSNINN